MKETHQLLQDKGTQIFSKAFDIIDIKAIATFVNEVAEEFGSIDVLVNNAAVMPGTRLEQLDESTVDQVIAVNLKSSYFSHKVCQRLDEEIQWRIYRTYVQCHWAQWISGSIDLWCY